VRHRIAEYLEDDKFTVVIGGEHSVAVGAIRAYAKRYPKMTVLQLDAHADLRPEYHGSKYNHACVMARVREVCPFVQVGVRSMDIAEREFVVPENMFYAEQIVGRDDWIKKVVSRLSDDVYITIDLDALDPAIMPSTGTPEPGGLGWYETLALLRAVAEKKNVVGFDVTELCPTKDNHAPDFLAAKLIYKLLGYRFQKEAK
jgi:agmatinase